MPRTSTPTSPGRTRKAFADEIRTGSAEGIHVFLFDNTFHAVYSTNYLMRVVDVLITKPSELAFYPVPKIFNERVGGHEAWGAIRSAELGDGTVEMRSIPETLNAIDLIAGEQDLMRMYCDSIIKNKQIGIYDGAYHSRCARHRNNLGASGTGIGATARRDGAAPRNAGVATSP